MNPKWVALSEFYPKIGMLGVPLNLLNVLRNAFKIPVETFPGPKPDKDWFLKRCLEYDNCAEEIQKIIKQAIDNNWIVYQEVWHPLTTREIEVDSNSWPLVTSIIKVDRNLWPELPLRVRPINHPATVWRWKGWYPAFNAFWSFIFHTSNGFLSRPDLILKEIDQYATPLEDDTTFVGMSRLHLAVYERILGITSDIKTRKPHYVQNIENRPELEPEENKLRIILFGKAVDYLRQEVEKKLLERAEKFHWDKPCP